MPDLCIHIAPRVTEYPRRQSGSSAMGPFPHDAPAATISTDNPMGTDGFEFVEYAHPKPEALHALFKLMGYVPVARHRTKKITVYRQGDINYLVNEQPGTHGFTFVAAHGPCAPSMAFRVVDAKQAYQRALTSPDGKIRIPINEDAGDSGQIEEYLNVYRGEGIQHIACGARDIYQTVETLRADGLPFMPPPPTTYFEKIDARLPKHGEDVARLKRDGILIDGEGVVEGGHTKVLLQIFSANAIGPIFFEFIQRKGDDGFGEGNFKALFESIEEDQIRRGVLTLKGVA